MAASWLLAGGIIGILSGLSLRRTVTGMHPGASGRAVILAMAGAILRWGLATGLLFLAVERGIVPALLAFAGLWLTRWGMVYWANRSM